MEDLFIHQRLKDIVRSTKIGEMSDCCIVMYNQLALIYQSVNMVGPLTIIEDGTIYINRGLV
jgi:hypothetical protein